MYLNHINLENQKDNNLNVRFCKRKLNTHLAKYKTSVRITYETLIQISSMSFELFTSYEISPHTHTQTPLLVNKILYISKIQLVVYYQCCVLID